MARAPRNLMANPGRATATTVGRFSYPTPPNLAAPTRSPAIEAAISGIRQVSAAQARLTDTITGRLDRLANVARQGEARDAAVAGERWGAENAPTADQLQWATPGAAGSNELATVEDEFLPPGRLPTPPTGSSVYEQAARRSMLAAIRDTIKVSAYEDFAGHTSRIAQENASPQELARMLNSVKDGYVERVATMDPNLSRELDAALTIRASEKVGSYRRAFAKTQAKAKQLLARRVMEETLRLSVTDQVATGDQVVLKAPGQGGGVFTVESRIKKLIEEQIAIGDSHGLSAEFLSGWEKRVWAGLDKERETLVKNWVSDGVGNVDGLQRLAQMRSGAINDGAVRSAFEALESNERDDLISGAERSYSHEIAAVSDRVNEYIKTTNAGLPGANVSGEVELLTHFAPWNSGAKSTLENYNITQLNAPAVDALKGIPLVGATNMVMGVRAKLEAQVSVTKRERMLLAASESTLATMAKALADDPLGWAQRNGFATTTLNPIDGNSYAARRAEAMQVAGRYGTQPRFFTDVEAMSITAVLQEGDWNNQALVLGSIVEGLGPDALRAMGELATKDAEASIFAYAGGMISRGQLKAAEQTLRGHKIPATVSKVDKGLMDTRVMGNAFSRTPIVRNAVQGAATAHYKAAMLAAGNDLTMFDSGIYESSLRTVLGEVGDKGGLETVHGNTVPIPATFERGRLGELLEVLGKIGEEGIIGGPWLEQVSLTGNSPKYGSEKHKNTPVTGEDIDNDKWTFEFYREGQYWLVKDGFYLADADGPSGRYVLDAIKLDRLVGD